MAVQLAQQIAQSLERGIAAGVFPGGICCLLIGGRPAVTVARGTVGVAEHAVPVAEDTVYDLASLTKVVAVLPLILLCVQRQKLSLADPAVRYLPELARGRDAAGKAKITVLQLLTHTSGLPAWRPFFLACRGREAYLRAIAAEALAAEPGQRVIYSDLGFMLLGFLLERIWDEALDQLAQRLVFAPLGMRQTAYRPLDAWRGRSVRIAPTEDGNRYESQMVAEYLRNGSAHADSPLYAAVRERWPGFAWRTGVICGTVHDGNAHYGLAGVSGHAGLFSSVGDLARYMRVWTEPDGAGLLDPALRDFATRCHSGLLAPKRALGWEKAAAGGTPEQLAAGSSGGEQVSPAAFGHTGFTGTSIWHDPLCRATLITLTNRVHPRVSEQIRMWRRAHHDAVFAAIQAGGETQVRGGE